MPPNTVYVGRPSKWGNHIRLPLRGKDAVIEFEKELRWQKFLHPKKFEKWIAPLRGKNLACWCSLDSACHADVLLELANEGK